MLQSMTGYGQAEIELSEKKIIIEIKTLNSKQTDINARISSIYRNKETEIRKFLSSKLLRGKIDFSISVEYSSSSVDSFINDDAVNAYYQKIKKISEERNIPIGKEIFNSILSLPEVIQASKAEFCENEWNKIEKAIAEATDKCIKYRLAEGKDLYADFQEKIKSIQSNLQKVLNFEDARIETLKNKIKDNLNKHLEDKNIDENRFEQELIYYIEKFDINEEKKRLEAHCNYFLEILEEESSQGKKLSFICQEIGREINTLGSKANHSEMQKIIVNMKDDLEKIKEQLFNTL